MKYNNIMIFIILAFFVLISGCATTGKFDAQVKSWIGADINKFILAIGPPDDVFKMPDGRIMYSWMFDNGSVYVGNYNKTTNLIVGGNINKWCKLTYIVKDDVITGYQYNGNYCKSK